MAIWHVAPLRFAPAFRALGVCEHIWPFSLRDIWAILLSPKWAEIFLAKIAGDETSLPPWEMGKQLVWDVTVVNALAPSRLKQGSLCKPGTTPTEAEARKIEKYRELKDNGYFFQPVALEVQGSLGQSSEIFITRLCKMLCRSHNDQRVGSFLKQRISVALQIGNSACVLGTVSDRDAFEEIYYT